MNHRSAKSKNAQSRDDESEADFSVYNYEGFANDGDHDGDHDGELAKAMTNKVILSSPSQQKSKYSHAANMLRLVVGASGNPIEHLTVAIGKRPSDDGNVTVRTIVLILPILSPRDASKHVMRFSKKGTSENPAGYMILEYQSPKVSEASYADLDQVLAGLNNDIKKENVGNGAITADEHTTANTIRATAVNDLFMKGVEKKTKQVKANKRFYLLPFCPDTNKQLVAHNLFWQGADYASKPEDQYSLRGRVQPTWFEEEGDDGTKYEGCRFHMVWEFPVSEMGQAKLDRTPSKVVSQKEKLAAAKAMFASKMSS